MMSSKLKSVMAALITCVILPACASVEQNTHTQSAVKRNIAAQAIAPSDEQKANINIPADPTLRAAARERYKTGTVKKPVPVSTN